METIVLPLLLLRRVLFDLYRSESSFAVLQLVRFNRRFPARWLVTRAVVESTRLVSSDVLLEVCIGSSRAPSPRAWDTGILGRLEFGSGDREGHVNWLSPYPNNDTVILDLVGPGMRRLCVGSATLTEYLPENNKHGAQSDLDRWSRTIGALGGVATWRRLRDLRVGIVGVGRTGSLLATSAVRLGMKQIILIDPDELKLHNVSEMDSVTPHDIGQPKVEVIARCLAAVTGDSTSVTPIAKAVTDSRTIELLKETDLIISSPDSDSARLVCAFVATLFHKIHLDVGTGVHWSTLHDENEQNSDSEETQYGIGKNRRMGVTIRLTTPGDGCLLCRGGLGSFDGAMAELANGRLPERKDAWRNQRAGSLRSLNQIATGQAMRMVEDFVADRIQGGHSAQIEFDNTGRMRVEHSAVTQESETCDLCRQAGRGDSAMGW